MYRLSRKSVKHSDAKKLKAGHVLCVEHTKRFQRTFLDCLSGNKKRGAEATHGQSQFVEELWNFAKKTSLRGDSINLVLLLESPFTPPLINCPHLLFLSLVYHETVLQLNPPADCSLVWPPPRALNLLPGRHSFRP